MTPVRLDMTDPRRVAEVARQRTDVTLRVNNSGVLRKQPFIRPPDTDGARLDMETDYFGTLSMCRAFAPVLGANGGEGIVNITSAGFAAKVRVALTNRIWLPCPSFSCSCALSG